MGEDGWEERIPGVNTDADEETSGTAGSLGHFYSVSPAKSTWTSPTSPEDTALTSITTPRDSEGQSIGFVPFKESPDFSQQRHSHVSQHSFEDRRHQDYCSHHDLAVSATDLREHRPLSTPFIHSSKDLGWPHPSEDVDEDDDDMYYDDGMIDNLDGEDVQAFDESLFDDDTSRTYSIPIRDLKYLAAKDTIQKPEDIRQPSDRSQLTALDTCIDTRSFDSEGIPDEIAQRTLITDHQHPRPSSYDYNAGLTRDNLAAYHDALALAANQAALDGKFIRKPSIDDCPEHAPDDSTFSGMATDHNQVSHEIVGCRQPGNNEDTDEFDFDDTLSDDPIIAAANAEVLENDDEGFYGQEFGFFAHASGEAEYANGGYFGTRGADGIGRSHSGRLNFQEPSLTPITERSEWSNRTSTISLAMYGHPHPSQAQSVSNPGLAQLADMMQHDDDDTMTLSALLKLRRGAWGGSNTSLRSSAGSQQSGSPLSHLPPGALGAVAAVQLPASGSAHALVGAPSPLSASPPASPTVTTLVLQSAPAAQSQSQPQSQAPSQPHPQFLDPLPATSTRGAAQSSADGGGGGGGAGRQKGAVGRQGGHSRDGSGSGSAVAPGGGESVSYVKDVDADGVGRWWLETRRVGEGGEGVVVGRRVVEGGRI